MAAPKGHKRYGGKVKGSKNEKTLEWEVLGESITARHTERFNNLLDEAENNEFAKLYLEILKYFKPQLNRTEFDGRIKTENTDLNSLSTTELRERVRLKKEINETK